MTDGETPETEEPDNNEQAIYFMLVFSKEQDVDFNKLELISKAQFEPHIIYEKKIEKEENQSYISQKVFKLNVKKKGNHKKKESKVEKIKYEIKYGIEDDIYIISFYAKENSFIYDIELKKGDKYLGNIIPEDINQNIIQLYNKFEIFVEALGNNKSQIYKLYEETIDLYKSKKKFNILITLFLHIYDNKDMEKSNQLCSKLLSIFREISEKN